MAKFQEHFDKNLRLNLLQILAGAPNYAANLRVLNVAVVSLGFQISQDKINSEIDWLREQSFVVVDDNSGVRVAKITQRGLDVANGLSTNSGVEAPAPKA